MALERSQLRRQARPTRRSIRRRSEFALDSRRPMALESVHSVPSVIDIARRSGRHSGRRPAGSRGPDCAFFDMPPLSRANRGAGKERADPPRSQWPRRWRRGGSCARLTLTRTRRRPPGRARPRPANRRRLSPLSQPRQGEALQRPPPPARSGTSAPPGRARTCLATCGASGPRSASMG